MSNALEAASLIMVPSGYEDGTLASVKPNDGTGDFTFSRGSNLSATRINEQGYIEKGYENLLLQSNTFDTTWTQVSLLPPTSGQAGYDGTNDAWYFEKVGAFGRLQQSISTSGVQTLSVYLKAKDSSWVSLQAGGANTSRQYFDLTAPIETAKGSSNNIISSSIEDAGDGWRKCSITYEGTKTFAYVYIAEGNGQVNGTSGSLYIQDAMLNQGLVAYPYIETTAAPVSGGILEDMPRLDWASGVPSLLLEPSRTNIMPYSEYFDGFSFNTEDTTLVANSEIGPEGLQNAYKITADAVFNYHRIRQILISTSIGSSYTISIFAKSNGHNFILFRFSQISASNKNVSFNISTGEVDFQSSVFNNAAVEDYGNGWYRCWATFISDDPTMEWNLRSQPTTQIGTDDGIDRYTGDSESGAYIYGAQFEEGSYPTSYIPTYGVSQTRLQYSAFASNVASLIDSTQGTIFFEGKSLSSVLPNYNYFISLSDSTSANRMEIRQITDEVQFLWRVNNSYQSQIITIGITITDFWKVALKYSSTEIKMFFNGSLVDTISSPTLYSANTLNRVGFDDGYNNFKSNNKVKQVLVFPTALSDEECIQLTTV